MGRPPAALLAVWALAPLAACGPSSAPNVLLVVIDTLRADHSSVYGYARDTTPKLRALAEQGVRFERAYAPVGLTGPSHASLFTSLHPFTHGVVRNGLALGDEHVTLAEYLAVRGYQTAAVVSSFVLHRKFGLHQGYAFYDDSFPPAEATVEITEWEGHAVDEAFDRRADHTTRRASEWLRERRDPRHPFFLFVHYFDPHAPYEPPPSHAGRFTSGDADDAAAAEIDAYDAEIAFTDAALGDLLAALDELGLGDDTLVVVTADHGEGLMQRGYMWHGLSVHEEELRVPLVMRWPGRLPAGLRVAEPVSVLDVAATIADLVPLARGGGTREGRSLRRELLDGSTPRPDRPLFFYRRDFGPKSASPVLEIIGDHSGPAPTIPVAGAQFAVREGRWKYVRAPEESPPALYDLETDPGESDNRAEREPEIAERLRGRLEGWLGSYRWPLAEAAEPGAEDRARLRALGYAE